MQKEKIKTFRFYYEEKDGFGSIEFCSYSESEAKDLFNTWCYDNSFDNSFTNIETVWDKSDAELYGSEYWDRD